jgi:predicted RNase H-like nuclease (RuvC/YqgF family)
MSAEWDKVKAAALKILGKDAEVPDMPDVVQKSADSVTKARDDFDKAREECEGKVLALQNSNDAVKNALKQFEAKIEKSDFKLDIKNKENMKKVQQARKLLTERINAAAKYWEGDDKMLDELDKHIEQLGKYKPKDAPI